jgi:asparaginyl-tRNA synthetase
MLVKTHEMKGMVGKEASLRGWLLSKQDRGRIAFAVLRDGEGTAQLVCERERLGEEAFAAFCALPLESPIAAEGSIAWPEGRLTPELSVSSFSFEPSEQGFPIGRKEHGPEFLMDERHLWLRSPKQAAYLRIRSSLEYACVEFLHKEGFHRFDAPLITPTACEGTTQLFELDYFGKSAYLSQSAQLYSEAGIAALEKVYSFGPCFRAEKSVTRRHLTEFWGVEPEMAHVGAEENMAFQEKFIRAVLAKVAGERADDLAFIGRDQETMVFGPESFPIILYDEALKLLSEAGTDLAWGDDLSIEEEELLSRRFSSPFFIYKYPVKCRAFYIEPDPERPELALSSDCLMHGGFGEIITGGQRAKGYEFLKGRILEHGLSLEAFEWYLDLRRYGSVEHSGFGMGIERMMRWICNLHHIREAIPFARTPLRSSP